jgi:hypothetical protein
MNKKEEKATNAKKEAHDNDLDPYAKYLDRNTTIDQRHYEQATSSLLDVKFDEMPESLKLLTTAL